MSISVAIVIPVYRESSYIENTLRSIEKSVQFSLEKNWIPQVVVVVNNPTSVSNAFRNDNRLLIQNLKDIRTQFTYPIDILDYIEPGLANGVGEARKIGMNYAVAKHLKNPEDLIVSLDADCNVDLNYISTLFNLTFQGSGFTLYFEHSLEDEAMVYYELYLRYLRWGQSLAKSPFSFYSVGSCLGTSVKFYEKSGGMVAKSATEDFHFLNKLRKHGPILYVTDTTIRPSERLSQRVTLGTGYFLTEAKTGFDKAFVKLLIPMPEHFEKLKKTLEIIYAFDGSNPMSTLFENMNIGDVYRDLHQRNVIQKIHQIFETTTQPKIYKERLMEILDGLETLRILRNMWKQEAKNTKEGFVSWCNQLWKTNESNPAELLRTVRQREKATSSLSI